MNRARKTNKRLPRRVYERFNAYYFVPIEKMIDPADGKLKSWIRLCGVADGEAKMLSALSRLVGDRSLDQSSMTHLCAAFQVKKIDKSEYAETTKTDYRQYLTVIAAAFEDFRVDQVTTKDWADFLAGQYEGKANTARKVTALGRKLFKFAISQLGLRADNPLEQIDLDDYKTARRTVLPSHEQVQAIRAAGAVGKDGRITRSGPMFACLIDMAYLCWQRAIDVRTLLESQIVPSASGLVGGSIRFKPSKTARSSGLVVDIVITRDIADVIERARATKRKYEIVSGYLFCTTAGRSKGKPYTKSGLFSMWDRARERCGIADDIWFKDLRALAATDALKAGGLKSEAQKRLVHTTDKTTEIYIKDVIASVSNLDVSLPWKRVAAVGGS